MHPAEILQMAVMDLKIILFCIEAIRNDKSVLLTLHAIEQPRTHS